MYPLELFHYRTANIPAAMCRSTLTRLSVHDRMVIGLPFPRGRKERGAGVFEEDLSTVIFDSYDDQRLMGTLVGHSRGEGACV